jgi:hypothetical protein
VMNEPNLSKGDNLGTIPFAESMFSTAKSLQGTVPLTLGADRIEVAELFIPLGLNIIQYHDNFPKNTDELVNSTKAGIALGQQTGLPVWLTEWQRIRTSASGFGKEKISPDERGPDYASLASTVREYPIGSFFWCLMAKRAYLRGQRFNGTVNGLFWPDGSVTSLKDARAIANDPKLKLKESPFPSTFGMEAVQP